MAQVTLQAIVNFEQVNQLQQKIDKLNGQKITIGVQDFSRQLHDAERAVEDVNGELSKTVRVFNSDGELTRGVDEFKRGVATTVQVTHKLNEETGQLDKTQTKVTRNIAKEQREAAKGQQEHTEEVKNANKEVKQQGLLYDILGRSVSSFLARMVAYRAVYAGIRAITNGFKEALETLKAVDDELVTVRKVTGFDQWQMAGVEEQAYAVASKYGTSAADYTSGVAAFARAGYKDLSGDLAELAEKTKIVGDTTADVAQQFLLSVDAAYQYKGNIEKLTAVLDGANEIDNRFATSIEKIAEGMGIVAPVAAQMNVSVDELAAGIGTITAVTQRTGTEAARALRAIFLNIVGDTKTEIDEGVTWTTGEIEGLRDVIKLYAKDAWEAAQASGGIIDPMKAIEGLSKSVKDGVLTEAKLMEMVSDIGGKLRTSQLLAIVNNWDMYEQMLDTYRNAYGSADKEIENAMDSWSRKTEVLKNTWTQFVKAGLNSSAFKGALDALTWFVERLGTLPGLLTRLVPLFAALKLRDVAKNMKEAGAAANTMAEGMNAAGTAASTLNWIAAALAAISVAWNAVAMAEENAKVKAKERAEKQYEEAKAARESSDSILELYADFNSAKDGSDALTESAKKLAEALGTDIPEGAEKAGNAISDLVREKLLQSLAKTNTELETAKNQFASVLSTWNDWKETNTYKYIFKPGMLIVGESPGGWNARNVGGIPKEIREKAQEITSGLATRTRNNEAEYFDTSTFENAMKFREAMMQINDEIDRYLLNGGDRAVLDSNYYKNLRDYLQETADEYEKVKAAETALSDEKTKLHFLDLSSAIRVDSVEAYNDLIKAIRLDILSSDEEKESLIALAELYYPQYTEAIKESADEHEKEAEAANKAASAEDRLTAAKERATKAVRDLIPVLFDENGKLTEQAEAALSASSYLADLVQTEIDLQNQTDKANYATMRAQLAALATDAVKAAKAIMAAYAVSESLVSLKRYAMENGATPDIMRALTLLSALDELDKKIQATEVSASYVKPYTTGYTAPTSTKPTGGGNSSSGSGSHSSSTSTEDKKLTSLKERVTLLKSELSLMQARGDSEEDQIAKMREIQAALEAERAYLASIKGDQATINGLAEEWWNYQNKITDLQEQAAEAAQKQADAVQATLEATIALNNAERQRSVRVYNKATGQWEWAANPSSVASAREAYNNAMANLSDADLASYNAAVADWKHSLHRQALAQSGILPSNPFTGAMTSNFNTWANSVNGGPTYNFGGVTISEAQAKNMTVWEFAQLAGSLGIFNNSP